MAQEKLIYRVYDCTGHLVARCAIPEHAAVLMGSMCLDSGATIRHGRQVLWTEGRERLPGAESFDEVTAIMMDRLYPPTFQCDCCGADHPCTETQDGEWVMVDGMHFHLECEQKEA